MSRVTLYYKLPGLKKKMHTTKMGHLAKCLFSATIFEIDAFNFWECDTH